MKFSSEIGRNFAILFGIFAVFSAICSTASADEALLLGAHGHVEIAAEQRARVETATFEALVAAGHRVRLLADRHELTPAQRSCVRGECIESLRSALSVRWVVGIAVWGRPEDRARPAQVVVTYFGTEGVQLSGEAEVGERGIELAAGEAVQAAEAQLRPGEALASLRLHGRPVGAIVEVDEEPAGALPYRGFLPPGSHRVRVRQEGYLAYDEQLSLGEEGAEREILLRRPTPPRREPHPLNWLVAGTATALGAGMLIWGLAQLGLAGTCAEEDPSLIGCRERYLFVPGRDISLLTLGSLLAIGGATWAALQPITVEVRLSPARLGLGLRARF